jgi:hypothetical protein
MYDIDIAVLRATRTASVKSGFFTRKLFTKLKKDMSCVSAQETSVDVWSRVLHLQWDGSSYSVNWSVSMRIVFSELICVDAHCIQWINQWNTQRGILSLGKSTYTDIRHRTSDISRHDLISDLMKKLLNQTINILSWEVSSDTGLMRSDIVN